MNEEFLVEELVDENRGTKWIKTIICGCGGCRFIPLEERTGCPLERSVDAIWLYRMNLDYIGQRDYIDPLFPTALFGAEEELLETEELEAVV